MTEILLKLRPDILGVCEMGSREDLAALQQRLKDAGLDLPHSEWVQAADPDRHLALLSRFPTVARQPQTRLSYLLDETKLPVQRGFLDVTLQITVTTSSAVSGLISNPAATCRRPARLSCAATKPTFSVNMRTAS